MPVPCHFPIDVLNLPVRKKSSDALRGQRTSELQDSLSKSRPKHGFPRLAGAGESQILTLLLSPFPHVLLHSPQASQLPQLPSTLRSVTVGMSVALKGGF